MGAEANTRVQRPTRRAHIGGPLRAHEDGGVPVTPIVGMGGKKAGRHPELCHAIDLILARHLRMDNQRPSLWPRMSGHCRLDRIKTIVY